MRAFGKIAFIFALAGPFGSAGAVDLVNRDRAERETVVNRSDGRSEVITLKPGQRIANICTACVILVGETSVETSGRTVVVIEGGKAAVAK
jgi:hypothetical protein